MTVKSQLRRADHRAICAKLLTSAQIFGVAVALIVTALATSAGCARRQVVVVDTPGAAKVVYVQKAPPAPRVEAQPPRPGPQAVWIPGHWQWNGRRYVWMSGHWEKTPRGAWTPGRWEKRPRGWVWVPGRWR